MARRVRRRRRPSPRRGRLACDRAGGVGPAPAGLIRRESVDSAFAGGVAVAVTGAAAGPAPAPVAQPVTAAVRAAAPAVGRIRVDGTEPPAAAPGGPPGIQFLRTRA